MQIKKKKKKMEKTTNGQVDLSDNSAGTRNDLLDGIRHLDLDLWTSDC